MTWTADQARDAASRYRPPATISDRLRAIAEARKTKLLKMQRARELHQMNHGQASPAIRMIVSPWFVDEFGNLTRTVRAAE